MLETVSFILLLLTSYLPTEAKTVDSSIAQRMELWKQCSGDDDCIVIEGICKSPVAINKKFKLEAEEYYRIQNAIRKCPQPSEKDLASRGLASAICRDGVAAVKYDKPALKSEPTIKKR